MTTMPPDDTASSISPGRRRPLDMLFAPRTIAVIGASNTPGSVGHTVLRNLVDGRFKGTIVPVHPQRAQVLDLPTYPSIADVPAPVDLAIIATPAATVPALVGACADAGVKSTIIFAAGFRERGAAGLVLEQEVLAAAERGDLRILGPNSLGVMRPPTALNATFAAAMARPGKVAFVSQSGALCTAILDWSMREQIGFSAFISVGSMLDVGWGEVIDVLADDPHTDSILLYMEGVGDARAFLSAAREVALRKPVIVLKAGRTAGAAQAVVSHTGALVGSDAVLDAALRRCGALRVDTIAELFYVADVLSKQGRPHGPRLVIVTNAGGPGVLAADAVVRSGGALASLSADTVAALDAALGEWSHTNPIDLLGDAGPERYSKALDIVARHRAGDGVLVIRTPQVSAEPGQVADAVVPFAKLANTPVLASWMGGAATEQGAATLHRANIPVFAYPDTAARMFATMWRYADNLRSLYETPTLPHGSDAPDRTTVTQMGQHLRAAGCTLPNEAQAMEVLGAYGIPTVPTVAAHSAEEAVALAGSMGYPVVLKLLSSTVTHKTDVGGVQLNLHDAAAVRHAYDAIMASVRAHVGDTHIDGVTVQPQVADGYELILGSSVDEQWGPMLVFGAGGYLVEVLDDRALGLPPLTTTLARRMIEQTRIAKALHGIRGRAAVDLLALEQVLVRFSQLVVEQPWIKEIEINPLLARSAPPAGQLPFVALDARVVAHLPGVSDTHLPKPAIRPYPLQYVRRWTLRDSSAVTIRPIRPEDEPLIVQFHHTLGERSVYLRYFAPMSLDTRTAHERLTRICFVDYDREIALVADREDPHTGEHAIIAVGRLIKLHNKNEAEYAGVVSDQWQGHGLGSEMLRQLLQVGRDERLGRIVADVLPENRAMQRVFAKLGFQLKHVWSEGIVQAHIDLSTGAEA